MAKILLVDDEPAILKVVSNLLTIEGHEAVTSTDGLDALRLLRRSKFDILLSDIMMKPMGGMELLRKVRVEFPRLPVVLLSGYTNLNTASEALALGVFDYLTKPIDVNDLREVVAHALAATATEAAVKEFSATDMERFYRFGTIIAASPAMQSLCAQVEQFAPSNANIIICGEHGTGKRAVAGVIRSRGSRRHKPLVTVNCADFPEPVLDAMLFGDGNTGDTGAGFSGRSIFKTADGGIVLFQEVDLLPEGTQNKLLNVLRKRKAAAPGSKDPADTIDVQILALSDKSVKDLTTDAGILPDLLSLMGAFMIEIPPLRERPEDVIPLALHFLGGHTTSVAQLPQVDPEVRDILVNYEWPGNAAELRHVAEHIRNRAKAGRIGVDDLPDDVRSITRQPRINFSANFMKSEYWAKFLKRYLRILCAAPSAANQATAGGKDETYSEENYNTQQVTSAVELAEPHAMFPSWTRTQLYDRITGMYLDCPDDSEIAHHLSSDLKLDLNANIISDIRVEAALAAETQPPAVRRRWIYRYRRLTVNNLAKEFMFLEKKGSFIQAKRDLAHEISTLVQSTPPDKLCIAVNDAMGRNNIGADLIHTLEAYWRTLRKMEDAAGRYADRSGMTMDAALLNIADKLTLLYNSECHKSVKKAATALGEILGQLPGTINEDDAAFFLEYKRFTDDEKSSGGTMASKLFHCADFVAGPKSVLQRVLDGAAHHISASELTNLTDALRSNHVMARTDLEQVREYVARYIGDIATLKRLRDGADQTETAQENMLRALKVLERVIDNHLSLLDQERFLTKKERARANRCGISPNDLRVVLERLNNLPDPDEVEHLANQIFDGKDFDFPIDRYMERRFRLPE